MFTATQWPWELSVYRACRCHVCTRWKLDGDEALYSLCCLSCVQLHRVVLPSEHQPGRHPRSTLIYFEHPDGHLPMWPHNDDTASPTPPSVKEYLEGKMHAAQEEAARYRETTGYWHRHWSPQQQVAPLVAFLGCWSLINNLVKNSLCTHLVWVKVCLVDTITMWSSPHGFLIHSRSGNHLYKCVEILVTGKFLLF